MYIDQHRFFEHKDRGGACRGTHYNLGNTLNEQAEKIHSDILMILVMLN